MEQWLKQLVPKHDPWAQVKLRIIDVVCILLHLPALVFYSQFCDSQGLKVATGTQPHFLINKSNWKRIASLFNRIFLPIADLSHYF